MVAGVATGTLAARALLGYAPAAPVFPPTLRVREVLEYFARFHVVGVARRGLVAAALERSGLAGAAERRAAGPPFPPSRPLPPPPAGARAPPGVPVAPTPSPGEPA